MRDSVAIVQCHTLIKLKVKKKILFKLSLRIIFLNIFNIQSITTKIW